jgi:2-polyprenyl-6-methoxyphenol hydroxylase-like FAD-dependent oxidoreductase
MEDGSMDGSTATTVLVVGAGIAGLAAARALHERHVNVEVVERDPAPAMEGAGLFLPANAVRALRALGLDVPADAARIERQRVADRRGRVLYEVDSDSLWNGVGPSFGVHRAALHQILLDGADSVPIHWDTTPRAIIPDPQGVDVTFYDGASGRYDLVIGADGARSTVRALVFGDGGLRSSGVHARRLLGPRPDTEPVWSVLLGRGVSFLTVPISADAAYHYCDTGPAGAGLDLSEILTPFAAPVPQTAAAATVVHRGAVDEVVLPSWSRGRVLLIGDAAHATPPNVAQGAAMAFEDALVLADTLASVGPEPAGLHAYERRRRPRIEWVQQRTRRRDRSRGMLPAVRDVLLRTVGERLFRADYRGLLAAA